MKVSVNRTHMAPRSEAVLYLSYMFGVQAAAQFLAANKGEMLPVAPLSYRATRQSRASFVRIIKSQRQRIAVLLGRGK